MSSLLGLVKFVALVTKVDYFSGDWSCTCEICGSLLVSWFAYPVGGLIPMCMNIPSSSSVKRGAVICLVGLMIGDSLSNMLSSKKSSRGSSAIFEGFGD